MLHSPLTRRKLLQSASLLPGAMLLGLGGGCQQQANQASCANPETLDESQLGLRHSLAYTDSSTTRDRSCSNCAYFSATASNPSCGSCELFNGPVSAAGHCSSWTAST